ncbi:MAG: hypothetical protein IJN17_05820 [Clostridia bacterium]|nr:hypothetical protein [Clostridia bacterium]
MARVARRDERFTLPFCLENDLIRLGSEVWYILIISALPSHLLPPEKVFVCIIISPSVSPPM